MTTSVPGALATVGPGTGTGGRGDPGATAPNRRPVAGAWLRFAGRRLLRLAVSLWVLVTFSFLIVHLIPGDPVRAALGAQASTAAVEAKRAQLGLDDPLLTQYLRFVGHLFTGDLGESIQLQVPVSQVISQRLPNTLELAGLAFLVTIALAFPLGVAAAVRTQRGRNRRTELGFATTAVVLATIPDFVLAVAFVFLFGVQLDVLPISGNDGVSSLVIPVLALAIGPAGALARIVRIETLGVLETDYVRTAKAKRLPPAAVYLRHAVPNALTATLTIGGLLLSGLIAGTVLVESVIQWPGLGPQSVSSIVDKDYPMVQGVVLVYGGLVLVINVVVDVLLALVDPRATVRDA